MMGSTTLTNNPVTDLTTVRQQLLAGKLAGARHELLILSDEGSNDAIFWLAKGIVTFFEGDEAGAEKLFQKAESLEDHSPSASFDQLYAQLLIEGALCKSLMRDTRADLVEMALETAEQLLVGHGLPRQSEVTTYIEILDHVATNKTDQLQQLHQKMTDAWIDLNDPVVQSWKTVLDIAALRSLCEHTRLADRLFAPIRGRATGYESTCVNILGDILQSDAPRRAKLTAVRIFIFGRVGVWK